VLVCDNDLDVVRAVNAAGIRIEGPVEQFTARASAVLPDELPSQIDGPVLIAVKAHHTAAVAEALAGRLAAGGYVVSLQNGLNAPVLSAALGGDRVVEAVVNFGADVLEPGIVLRGNRATFLIGELDGRTTDRVRALMADITDAEATDDISGYAWAKEAYGATLFATAVSDLPIHAVFDNPAYRPLLVAVAAEVLRQAPVRALPLDGFDPADVAGSLDRLAEFNRLSAKTHSGIYRDLTIRHRKTETEAILGPLQGFLIRQIEQLILAIERGERLCTQENLDLLATYERLDRLGRPVNAVVSVASAPARAQSGSLSGLPVAIKDIIGVAGLPTRCGSPATSAEPARNDAVLVARLREAGAEIFATSQCLEFAAGFAHPDVGDTRNPSDTSRTSGGSSGGSAALVAAGVCDLAIGTDTGGSIRIPAAYCGVVGLKPSYGLVPLDGVFALSPSCDHAGTLTSTVGGSSALLTVIGDVADPASAQARSAAAPTIGVLAAQLADPSVTEEVRAAIGAALDKLAAAGWRLREVGHRWVGELPRWEHALAIIVASEAYQVHKDRDTARYADGTKAVLDFGRQVTPAQYEAAQAERADLQAGVEECLAGVDLLAGPTVGYCAPEEDPPFGVGDDNAEGRFTGPYNLSGHPAVSIPVPTSGMPVGLQLAGRRNADVQLLGIAAAAEHVLADRI